MHRIPAHRHCSRQARGFTYLWLLFAIAAASATAAAIGARTSSAVQRDKEAELGARGLEIERAIEAYWTAYKELPRRLEDLVGDRRSGALRRYLRRVYADPFTGQSDWVLITDAEGERIRGVHSRSNAIAFDIRGMPTAPPGVQRRISERIFSFTPAASRPADAASAPPVPQ